MAQGREYDQSNDRGTLLLTPVFPPTYFSLLSEIYSSVFCCIYANRSLYVDFHYSTAKRPEKRPIKDPALQYRSMPRKASSAWDLRYDSISWSIVISSLRPSPVNRQLTLNGGHYAESDLVPDRWEQPFISLSQILLADLRRIKEDSSHLLGITRIISRTRYDPIIYVTIYVVFFRQFRQCRNFRKAEEKWLNLLQDLFGSGGFNYLRYAKASELQLMETTWAFLLHHFYFSCFSVIRICSFKISPSHTIFARRPIVCFEIEPRFQF